jgi:hypothetical protein
MADSAATATTTVLIFALVGSDNVTGVEECVTYHYFDDAASPDFFKQLLRKCDGRCYDACTDKQRRRLDALFDMVEEGRDAGWAAVQGGQRTTTWPEGFSRHVSLIATVTAIP